MMSSWYYRLKSDWDDTKNDVSSLLDESLNFENSDKVVELICLICDIVDNLTRSQLAYRFESTLSIDW